MAAGNSSAVQNHRHLVPGLYIGRAGHDLRHFAADIYLADNQLVRIGMGLNLLDLPDHDIIQIRIGADISFHLRSGQCHRIRVLLRGHIQFRNISLDP